MWVKIVHCTGARDWQKEAARRTRTGRTKEAVAGRVLCIAGDWDNVTLLLGASLALRLTSAVLNTLSVRAVDFPLLRRIHLSFLFSLSQIGHVTALVLVSTRCIFKFLFRKGRSHVANFNPSHPKVCGRERTRHTKFYNDDSFALI